jgi:hypothetical protein
VLRHSLALDKVVQMLKIMFTFLVLASAGLAQSSRTEWFSVHHSKQANFSMSPAQMREAESVYQSACAVVQHDFRGGSGELHPQIEVTTWNRPR